MLLDHLAGRAGRSSRYALRPGLAGQQKLGDAPPLRVVQPTIQDTHTTMLSGLVHRLRRTSCTLLHRSPEPQEEAPATTAPQGKDTIVRRDTTRPRRSIENVRPQLLCHDTPSRLESSSSRRRLTLSSDLLRTTSAPSRSRACEEPCLAHSRGGCSCAVTQADTMPEAWKVMSRRWKTAKFVQAHNELAARRGAPLATINPPPIRSTASALQEYRRTQLEPPAPCACCNAPPRDAPLHATVRSDSPHFPRRGAGSKLLPLPSPINAQELYSERLSQNRKQLESMHAGLGGGLRAG